jgi:cbb3-type cytochrome oxidase subunit 3
MVSLLINIISFITVLVLTMLHYLYWEPNYNRDSKDEKA